jgi:hypothetical protein
MLLMSEIVQRNEVVSLIIKELNQLGIRAQPENVKQSNVSENLKKFKISVCLLCEFHREKEKVRKYIIFQLIVWKEIKR